MQLSRNLNCNCRWPSCCHVAAVAIAIASCCLLGKPQIKQRNPGGACNQWRRKKVKKKAQANTHTHKHIEKEWNPSKQRDEARNMQHAADRNVLAAACGGEAWQVCSAPDKCSLHANKLPESATETARQRRKRAGARASTHVSARAFICRFRFRLSSSATSSGAVAVAVAVVVAVFVAHCCCCGQFQCSHCALISRRRRRRRSCCCC